MTDAMRVGIAGLGTIGLEVARRLASGAAPGLVLAAVSARDHDRARRRLADVSAEAQVCTLAKLSERADVIVECAPASVFLDVARPAIARGLVFMPLSVGVLLRHMELVDQAAQTGARIVVPTGALLGLDAIKAIAEGEVSEIRLETRKPPRGLAGAPYLSEHGIDLDGLDTPLRVFSGNAREAAAGFPANVNVAAALALAGIGPERTTVEIWADPGVTRNTHTIVADSDSSRLRMTIENIPTEENPPTGRITALSVMAALRRLTAPLAVGS